MGGAIFICAALMIGADVRELSAAHVIGVFAAKPIAAQRNQPLGICPIYVAGLLAAL